MNFLKYSLFTAFVSFLVFPTSALAQDLLAKQAPIDRRLKAVDSVSLKRLLDKEKNDFSYEETDLYASWNNEVTHCYSTSSIPENFKIDLRGFSMPTPSRTITSKYGYRPAFRRMHKGLDIKVYTGDTIYAAFDGKVRVVKFEKGGYGKYVVIRHSNGLETIYAHMSKQLVKTDDVVKSGQPIGLGGNTGRSSGSHLHFETRLVGVAIDPALLFDFANQDVTGDFYVYNNIKESPASVASNDNETEMIASNASDEKHRDRSGDKYYKVRKGESLYSISTKLGITVGELSQRNNIKAKSRIRPGQILRY